MPNLSNMNLTDECTAHFTSLPFLVAGNSIDVKAVNKVPTACCLFSFFLKRAGVYHTVFNAIHLRLDFIVNVLHNVVSFKE